MRKCNILPAGRVNAELPGALYYIPMLHRQLTPLHKLQKVTANQVELIKGLPSSRMTHIYTPDLHESDNQLALQLPEHNPMTLYPHPKQH